MVRSKITLKPNSIKNILTLRYNPTTNTQIKKKTWKDFVEVPVSENASEYVEQLITSNIEQSVKNSKKTSVEIGRAHV